MGDGRPPRKAPDSAYAHHLRQIVPTPGAPAVTRRTSHTERALAFNSVSIVSIHRLLPPARRLPGLGV
jgi:hypothetical protein